MPFRLDWGPRTDAAEVETIMSLQFPQASQPRLSLAVLFRGLLTLFSKDNKALSHRLSQQRQTDEVSYFHRLLTSHGDDRRTPTSVDPTTNRRVEPIRSWTTPRDRCSADSTTTQTSG